MNPIEERIDTFETEEMVHNAKMSYGDMHEMYQCMDKLGEQLVQKETALQSLTYALRSSVSEPKMEQILNLASDYMARYAGRFTTDEMREKLRKEDAGDLIAVLVDANFAEEAIENGREVFAIKAGEMVMLNKHGDASQYETAGYLLAVTPHTYEAEFCDDLDRALDE